MSLFKWWAFMLALFGLIVMALSGLAYLVSRY